MAASQNARNGVLTHSNSERNTAQTSKPRSNNNNNSSSLFSIPKFSSSTSDHPVEVVGRIRDFPDRKDIRQPAFVVVEGSNEQNANVRIKTEIGYRDFSLDGISMAEKEDLTAFYNNYIEQRVYGIRTGGRCTIIMYGPTGSGKSYTMFGSGREPGIVYRALHDILGERENENGVTVIRHRLKVKVTILEIYNEEIFDLLATGATTMGWLKNGGCREKLEVIGKKAKNATCIYGTEAGKITKEIAKVEKRRVVKSTLCNDKSSRSHCLIILDVPEVGGRLVLVDMAGSENIDQAGSMGPETKMQTGKINQGNIALKRVVESIANGDSHVPYRDSKLTMLLQDSFEDDGAKLLIVLCASPDPWDIHKTIGTLEYGAKAKCIVHLPNSPPLKDRNKSKGLDSAMLRTKILSMDEYIRKLQVENKLKEQERQAVQWKLKKKEDEVARLRTEIEEMEEKKKIEVEIQLKFEQNISLLIAEHERKCEEYERKANDFLALEHLRMEKHFLYHQEEAKMLIRRLEEIEFEILNLKSKLHLDSHEETKNACRETKIILKPFLDRANEQTATMPKVSEHMQLNDISSLPEIQSQNLTHCDLPEGGGQLNGVHGLISYHESSSHQLLTNEDTGENDCEVGEDEEDIMVSTRFIRKTSFPTEYENEESVDKENKGVSNGGTAVALDKRNHANVNNVCKEGQSHDRLIKLKSLERYMTEERRARLENIFLLCGNHREIAHARNKAANERRGPTQISKPVSDEASKEVGSQAFKTPPTSASKNSSLHSQKLIRSIGLDHSSGVSPSQLPTTTHSAHLSLSMGSKDLTCPKSLLFVDKYSGSKETASTSEPETTQHQLQEMVPIIASSNGLHSFSSLTERKSSIASCCGEKSKTPKDWANGEDGIQSPHQTSCDVYVKWEASSAQQVSQKKIGIMRIAKNAFLEDLRKMIEVTVKQDFIFLTLKDPSGAPVPRKSESSVPVIILPEFLNQRGGLLACLRLSTQQRTSFLDPCNSRSSLLSLPATPGPTSTLVQSSNCIPWPCSALKSISKGGNSSANSPSKSVHKLFSFPARLNGMK